MDAGIIFLYSIIFLIGIFLSLSIMRIFIKFYRVKKSLEEKGASKVGFVVDTFHDLVSQLKEKEKELETLRNKAEDERSSIRIQ
jgi:hypothetical protein